MATLTIRLPDDKHERLQALARSRGISLNTLMEELSTTALVEFETFTRFQAMAAQGSAQTGLQLLDHLDHLTQDRETE
ncbi:toxin-antitoxin system HicB family antitoxin [Leptolyngbya iicbica]|uniref:Toxin-antitoxin system HicB family antitoxin n=2 Tax=Cyanophyceae TaxID=3028117 RepID=A0A4Q7ECR4_9CYAN|nr:toxin-antitoxin system HicB family antitoxin [Leptolyngbya sp. LK]RZM79025.1 toxin-antitoxin system HicB family antitoxin [Leptolyngbya sp. LK]